MIEVKICGIRTPDALEAALEEGADFVGFVFFPPSPRHLTLAEGAALAARVRGRAGIVALTVDATPVEIDDVLAAMKPDVLQLHGMETAIEAAALRGRVGAVWKAAPVSSALDVRRAAESYSAVDRLLFDARPPEDATRPGGNGRSFRWNVFDGLDLQKPFVLSGGLDADNVAAAIHQSGTRAVDVSSGVESAPGVKDLEQIRAFMRAARAVARHPQSVAT